jgi:hypothetical protein
MTLFLVFFGACNGCQPKLPYVLPPDDDTSSDDTADTDTATDTDTIDTSLPPLCDLVEVEPNDQEHPQALPMEQWMCGAFLVVGDQDVFDVAPNGGGWVQIEVEAAERGSNADPEINIADSTGQTARKSGGYLTTDPTLVFPTDGPEPYSLVLFENNFLSGDDYSWRMRASTAKAPVEWDYTEIEPNDAWADAQPLVVGQTVYGVISESNDFDRYVLTTPYDHDQNVVFNVTAYKQGSAANLKLQLYDDPEGQYIHTKDYGQNDYDLDPWMQWRTDDAEDLYLLVRDEGDGGSRFYWYILEVTVEDLE